MQAGEWTLRFLFIDRHDLRSCFFSPRDHRLLHVGALFRTDVGLNINRGVFAVTR